MSITQIKYQLLNRNVSREYHLPSVDLYNLLHLHSDKVEFYQDGEFSKELQIPLSQKHVFFGSLRAQ